MDGFYAGGMSQTGSWGIGDEDGVGMAWECVGLGFMGGLGCGGDGGGGRRRGEGCR